MDLEIIRSVRSKGIGLRFTKNISKLMIFRRNVGKINRVLRQISLVSRSEFEEIGKMNAEALESCEFSGSEKRFSINQ